MKIDQDNIYWLFSSSAQSISAFIAFLLTGYAFVHTVMESVQQRDDSLSEIHHELSRQYYRSVKRLSFVTGLAIISSLTMVYLNGIDAPYKAFWVAVTAGINLFAIIGGILFVLSIIDPNRYKKTATKIVAHETQAEAPAAPPVRDSTFFDAFVQLELLIKRILVDREMLPLREGPPPRFASFRQMITALHHNGLIDRQTFDELQEIGRLRNLVFHGQIQQVDRSLVDRIRSIAKRLKPDSDADSDDSN